MKTTQNVRSNVQPSYVSCDEFHVYVATDITELNVPSGLDDGESRIEYDYTITEYTKEEFNLLLMDSNANTEDTLIDHDYRMCLIELGL